MSSCRLALHLLLTLLTLTTSAFAFTHGVAPNPPPPPSSASVVQQGLNEGEVISANFTNVLKTCPFQLPLTFAGGADIGNFDADGYPIATMSNSYSCSTSGANVAGDYRLFISAGRSGCIPSFTVNSAVTFVSATGGATHSGGSNNAMTVTPAPGVDNTVRFTKSTTGGWSFSYPAGSGYCAGSGAIAVYLVTDETRYQTDNYFRTTFETVLSNALFSALRPMHWIFSTSAFSNHVQWAYRQKLSNFCWFCMTYPPTAVAGSATTHSPTISGTVDYTMEPATDTPLSGWVDGEVIIGNLQNQPAVPLSVTGAVSSTGATGGLCRISVASTASLVEGQEVWPTSLNRYALGCGTGSSTHTIHIVSAAQFDLNGTSWTGTTTYNGGGLIGTANVAINGKTGGRKFMANAYLNPPRANDNSSFDQFSAGPLYCWYQYKIDKIVCTSRIASGVMASIPVEAQVQLANHVNTNLSLNIPMAANKDYAVQQSTAALGLNSNLFAYFELANEVFISTSPATGYYRQMGLALNLTASSTLSSQDGQPEWSYLGLRNAQFMKSTIPTVWAGRTSKLRRVLAYQEGSLSTNVLTWLMQGQNLAPSGTSTGTGNANYVAFTNDFDASCAPSGCDYTAAANQPGNQNEVFSGAPYVAGLHLCTGPDLACTPGAADAPWHQALVDAVEAGNMSLAISMVNDDVSGNTLNNVSQVASCVGSTITTTAPHNISSGTPVRFTVSGGSLYGGFNLNQLYNALTASGSTMTLQAFVAGQPSGAALPCGSAATGTVSIGDNTRRNLQKIASLWNPYAEFLAASFDLTRPGGMAPVRVEPYEAQIEVSGPTAARCGILGILIGGLNNSTTQAKCAADVQAAIVAWLNDASSAATIQLYYAQKFGTDATNPPTYNKMLHTKGASNFLLTGTTGQGSITPILSTAFPDSTPYFTYCGIKQQNGGVGC